MSAMTLSVTTYGNSRNGYYERNLKTTYGTLPLQVPRDRLGKFVQGLIPAHQQIAGNLETTVIQLYQKGITTREIGDLIQKMYGHHYSPATLSNITKLVDKDVKAFHSRSIKSRYVMLFRDATFISVRRDSVQKEGLHSILAWMKRDIRKYLITHSSPQIQKKTIKRYSSL